MQLEYLSPIDAAFVRMESARTPMHVGGLLVFRLPAQAPRRYLRDLYAHMRSQAVVAPPFNYRLAATRWSRLAPAWVVDPQIDLDYHLRDSALPYPGGDRELGTLISRLHSQPMDLSRPPWECHLIEGLGHRRFAIYLKMHHAAIDGIAALRCIRDWLSEDPACSNAAGPWALPPRPPAEPAGDHVQRPRSSLLRHALDLGLEQVRAGAELLRTLRRMARVQDNPEGGLQSALHTPRTLFNTPITQQRRFAGRLFELQRFTALGRVTGTTVNDLSLAVCAGALRRYLLERDALPAVPLVASVPVGLPRPDGRPGNAVAGFVCPLPTQLTDPLQRLQTIHAVTRRTKQQLQGMSAAALGQFTLLGLSPLVLGQMSGLQGRLPPFFNMVVSNVIGARQPLYLRGAELEAMFPLSILFDGYGLNISIVGYVDRLALGFIGCRDTIPNLQRLALYTEQALAELERAAGRAQKRATGRKGAADGG